MRKFNDDVQVLQATGQLFAACPGAVLVGGVAVNLHVQNHRISTRGVVREQFAEFSHDVDAYVSLQDFGALRDLIEVVSNPRLRKHQARFGAIESDLYVERNNGLRVPYDELFAQAVIYGNIRVAAVGHLLVLKLDALADRAGSAKGDKDRRDVVRLVLLANRADHQICTPYFDKACIATLSAVGRSPGIFVALARGNAQHAKWLREAFTHTVGTMYERESHSAPLRHDPKP